MHPLTYALILSDQNFTYLTEKGNYFIHGNTRDKEESRRVSAIKQNMEEVPYRTNAKNLGVNYQNV